MQLVEGTTLKTFIREPKNDALERFCKHLLSIKDLHELAKYAASYSKHCPSIREEFPKVDNGYSRNIIHRLDNGFEAMVARWSEGAHTVAHRHPAFGYYHLLDGRWRVESFERTGNTIQKISDQTCKAGEHFTIKGIPDRFDNGIHKIHILQESLSFHVYSDNALKGECYAVSNQDADTLACSNSKL